MSYLIGTKPAPSEKDEQVIPETWIDNLTWLEHQMQSVPRKDSKPTQIQNFIQN